jgi:hypothetical protein
MFSPLHCGTWMPCYPLIRSWACPNVSLLMKLRWHQLHAWHCAGATRTRYAAGCCALAIAGGSCGQAIAGSCWGQGVAGVVATTEIRDRAPQLQRPHGAAAHHPGIPYLHRHPCAPCCRDAAGCVARLREGCVQPPRDLRMRACGGRQRQVDRRVESWCPAAVATFDRVCHNMARARGNGTASPGAQARNMLRPSMQ